MNETRRSMLQALFATPAVAALSTPPTIVEGDKPGRTLLVFKLTKPATQAAVQACADNIRKALDGHGFADIRAIVLPEYLDMKVHAISEGAEKCSVSEQSNS
jgi:hypothetical protein